MAPSSDAPASTNPVLTISARHYVVMSSVGTNPRTMMPTCVVVDTGSGYIVIRRNAMPPNWEQYVVDVANLPNLGDANGNPLHVRKKARLRLRLGDAAYTANFLVVNHLACRVLIGTEFLDRHVDVIKFRQRMIYLTHSIVLILGTGDANAPYKEEDLFQDTATRPQKVLAKTRQPNKPIATLRVRLSRPTRLPPFSQVKARVLTQSEGLIYTEPRQSVYEQYRVRTANGVHEVYPNEPFELLLSNFSNTERKLPGGMLIAHAAPSPLALIPLKGDGAQEMAQLLNIVPLDTLLQEEIPLSQEDLANAAPDQREAPPKEDGADTTAGPSTMEEAPAPPTDAGPVPKQPSAPLRKDWRELVDLSHINDEKLKARIFDMLPPHRDMWSGELGKIRATEHRIELEPDTRPIHQHPYRAGPESRKVLEEHLNLQLKTDVIEPAQSEWATPVLLAPKNDGTLRFCIYYRRLNMVTIVDTYPLSCMQDCIDSLGEAHLLTTLDALWGYWQVPIAECDRDKTTFTTHMGTFRYKRMLFGLRNVPATFQRALDVILLGVRCKTCLIYIDDVVIFSETQDEHFEHVDHVLGLLREAGFKLKLKKCFFFHERVEYLSHIITPGRLSVANNAKATCAVRQATFPRTITQLKSSLGACNVYRRFVKDYAKIATPLSDILRKDAQRDWHNPTEEQSHAFESLKVRLTEPPILALPKSDRPLMIDTALVNIMYVEWRTFCFGCTRTIGVILEDLRVII